MTCIQDREFGNYTASDWQKRNKYTDDAAVDNLDESLDQKEVFNRLTNNGQLPGLFMYNNQLYVNASYIRSGEINTDLLNVDEIFAKNITANPVIAGLIPPMTVCWRASFFMPIFCAGKKGCSVVPNLPGRGLIQRLCARRGLPAARPSVSAAF